MTFWENTAIKEWFLPVQNIVDVEESNNFVWLLDYECVNGTRDEDERYKQYVIPLLP